MQLGQLIRNVAIVGSVASAVTTITALAGGRRDAGSALAPMNAVSHIAWGGAPPAGEGSGARNTAMGLALHTGACLFWASVFELVFGRSARRSPTRLVLGGLQMALLSYVTDYHVVSARFRPGYERYLSKGSLAGVYVTLAGAFALGAALTRRA
jgi:hypothetical protein